MSEEHNVPLSLYTVGVYFSKRKIDRGRKQASMQKEVPDSAALIMMFLCIQECLQNDIHKKLKARLCDSDETQVKL